jgi:EmrB/QacA subfamily drug resistance transporter
MTVTAATGPVTGYRWRWPVLAVVLVAEAMDILDTTTVNVAGPSVRRSIGGGTDLVQWLSASYTLALAVLLITGGRLGDRYGHRRMFLAGAAGFTAASAACGLSLNPGMLIAFRLVQGSFGAILLPQGISLIAAAFAEREIGKAFGLYAPVLSVAATAGPVVAGGLIRWDLLGAGWRLVFFVNLVLGAAAVGGGLRCLPADGPPTLNRLDGRGAVIVAAATLLVIYPLIQGRQAGWPWWAIASLAAGAAGFWLFARHERRSGAPLVEPALLHRRTYLAGTAVAVAFFAAAAGFMLVLSLYAQYGLGYSALGAGAMLLPATAGNVAGALAATRLVPRAGGRIVIQLGLGIAVAALAAIVLAVTVLAGTRPSGLTLAGPVLAFGFGLGAVIAPLFSTILAGITPAETGSASGSLGAIQQLAGSAGVAAIATVYTAAGPGGAHGLAVTAAVTAALLAAGGAVTFLLPAARP